MTSADRRLAAPGGRRSGLAAHHRVRMEPDRRVNMIVDGAMAFFAEHGFMAQTRELAHRVGVSQSLIFHYFRTKEVLIERVHERCFLTSWCQDWIAVITDRDRPLAARLKAFYSGYMRVIDDNDWIRIAMFSGLEGADLARRYIEGRIEGLLHAIAVELANEFAPDRRGDEPGEIDLELVWHLHSTFIHYLVRKHIFRTRTLADRTALIEAVVDHFLAGAAASGQALPERPRDQSAPRVEAAE